MIFPNLFPRIRTWIRTKIEYGLAYFGYFKPAKMTQILEAISEEYQENELQLQGCLSSIGHLQEQINHLNLVVTCLISLSATEEVILKHSVLSDIISKDLETIFVETPEGDMKCIVQFIPPNTNNDANP